MAKKLIKKELDEAIRANKKFYSNRDKDLEEALCLLQQKKMAIVFKDDQYWASSVISGITCKGGNYSEPYKTYYKVLEALDFEIVEE